MSVTASECYFIDSGANLFEVPAGSGAVANPCNCRQRSSAGVETADQQTGGVLLSEWRCKMIDDLGWLMGVSLAQKRAMLPSCNIHSANLMHGMGGGAHG
jgi:hypothetical protein